MEKTTIVFVVAICLGLLFSGYASALDFDNVKSYDEDLKIIIITNAFGLGDKLAEYKLTFNTDYCLIDCYAEGTATIYSKDKLFSDLNFKGKDNKFKSIKSNKILIEVEEEYIISVGDYKDNILKNGSIEKVLTGTHEETRVRNILEEYNGEDLELGTYKWRIEGTKNKDESVDWIASAFGEDFTEWAWWNSSYDYKRNITGMIDIPLPINGTSYTEIDGVNTLIYGTGGDSPSLYYQNNTLTAIANYTTEFWKAQTQGFDDLEGYGVSGSTPDNLTLFMPFDNNGTKAYLDYVSEINGSVLGSGGTIKTGLEFGGANYFGGIETESHDGVLIEGVDALNSPEGTVIMVFQAPEDCGATRNILLLQTKDTATVTDHIGINMAGAGESQFILYMGREGGRTLDADCTGWWSEDDWINLAVTWQSVGSDSYKVYANKVLKASSTTDQTITDGATAIEIGTNAGISSGLASSISHIMVFDRILTSAEINATYDISTSLSAEEEAPVYPTITLNEPIDDYNSTLQDITFNCSATYETGIINLSLLIDGVTNYTIYNTSENQNLSLKIERTLSEGEHNWSCRSNNAIPKETISSNRTLSIDSIIPFVNITYPYDSVNSQTLDNNLTINWTITDTNLDSCIGSLDGGISNISLTCADNNVSINITSTSNNTFYLWANDTFGNSNYNTSSWIYNLFENSQTYNATTYETSTENFILNVTYNTSSYISSSALLNYNGTNYSSTGTTIGVNTIFTTQLDIPLISTIQNKSFNWAVTLYDGSSSTLYPTSYRLQEIDLIWLAECNATYTTKSLNFSVYDEGNLSLVKDFSFDGTFNYWLGNGNAYKNLSMSKNSINSTELCLFPNQTMNINANIEYDKTGYTKRSYFFNDYQINNTLQYIDLFLLFSEDSTTFIQEVLENQEPIEGAYIYTYRYYPGTDSWGLTQVTQTDSDGKTSAFYEVETTNYKHTIVVDGVERLVETEGRKILPESTPYTITFNLGTPVETPYKVYDDELNLTKNLSYSNNTYLATYTYTDSNTTNSGGRLYVYKENYAIGNELICNTTSALSSSTITCNLTDYSGQFVATGYITRNSVETVVDQIRFSKGTGRETFGMTGVILGWFIILTAGMVFLINPILGIIAIDMAVIFVNVIGFVSFGATFLFGIIIVSILIAWIMKN